MIYQKSSAWLTEGVQGKKPSLSGEIIFKQVFYRNGLHRYIFKNL